MKRALAVLALGTFIACEQIAPVDLHYTDSGPDADAHVQLADSGPVTTDDAAAVGTDGLCACDFTQGEGCCAPGGGGPAFCTTNRDGCAQQGGIYVACYAYDPTTDSNCCWTGPTTAGSEVVYASTCANGPSACATSNECNGGTCNTVACGGVTIGACDATPVCP